MQPPPTEVWRDRPEPYWALCKLDVSRSLWVASVYTVLEEFALEEKRKKEPWMLTLLIFNGKTSA